MRLPIAAMLMLGLTAPVWADQDGLLVRFDASDPVQVNDGFYLYQEHCAACHGENLEGEEDWQMAALDGLSLAPPHDDSGHSWHHADDELFEMTKYGFDVLMGWEEGTSTMIGYGDILSDEEILAILAFIKSNWSPQSLEWQTMVDKGFRAGWQPFSGLPQK